MPAFSKEDKEKFVDFYFAFGCNASAAYRATFPSRSAHMEDRRIWEASCRLRKKLEPEIAKRKKEIWDELDISPEHVIGEIATVGFKPVEDEMVKTSDKLKALEMLGKTMGIFDKKEEKQEQVIKISLDN